ncbi:MAG: D-2-hydroxyacid dehydrogenase [Pseudomonadales bacterium]|nr:D-2-hydroxyacid dehydrogenase [Halioglobus sp.]MCP5121484.1 D-2-hydroxyacid dehydrogenase [Pseudomonadales bacterium]MCP5193175.1 D-2-hydroxyacid dehydrogenase [Pseudomonadales bacterium]
MKFPGTAVFFRSVCLQVAFLAGFLPSGYSMAADAVPPDPRVKQIVEELELPRSPGAMRDNPDWHPQRIVVSLPAGVAQQMPELEEQLRRNAGSVELVLDTSNNMVPTAAALAGADAYIGLCSPAVLTNASPRLLWVHNYTAGMEACAGLTPAQTQGRIFTNSKRLAGPAIAEHAIAMLLSLATGLPAYQRAQVESRWDRSRAAGAKFGELRGKTLLVVGLGGIGTEIAWRANSLGMQVIATRNSSREGPDFLDYIGLPEELPVLARDADVVVNALPLTAQTTGIFNQAFFDEMKNGAIFISVGRGGSTVTAALVAALQSGQLYGAGLDVTDPEPLPADNPLWQMSNVIITPHVSAASPGSMQRTAIIAAENLRRYVDGGNLLNVVDIQAGY